MRSARRSRSNVVRLLLVAIGSVCCALLIVWASLALYYSNLPQGWMRQVLAAAFAGFAVWAVWFSRRNSMRVVAAALFMGVAGWWLLISPSHDRNWRPEVATMPRAVVDGDRVRLSGVRNFEYRTRHDFTVRYEEREYSLSHLTGLDFYVSYWREGLVGHTFLSFLFDNAPPLTISIETRPEVGEGFDPLASLFKQFELIYNSCTINIIRYANAAGRVGRFDIRHFFNGLIDSYLYHSGRTDTSLPFDELRRRSHINTAVQAADGAPDFWQRIRAGLPVASR